MEKYCVYCNRPIYDDEVYYQFGTTYVCTQCGAIHSIRDICNLVDIGIRVSPVTIEVSETAGSSETVETTESETSLSGKTESVNTPNVELDKSKLDAGSTGKEFPLPNGCSKDCPYFPYATCGHYYGEIHECMLDEESSLSGKTESGDADLSAARNIYMQFHIRDDEGEEVEWDDKALSQVVERYGIDGANIPAHVKVNGYFDYWHDIVDPDDDTPDYYHDAECMSEEDFISKYADNPDALDYWIIANS